MPSRTPPEDGHHDVRVLEYLHWECGLSTAEMADVLEYSKSAIERKLRASDIDHRSAIEERTRQDPSPWEEFNRQLKSDDFTDRPDLFADD